MEDTRINEKTMFMLKYRLGMFMPRALSDTTSEEHPPYKDSHYRIEDVLSKNFAKSLAKVHVHRKWLIKKGMTKDLAWDISHCLHESYFNNGMRDIDGIIMEMLGA